MTLAEGATLLWLLVLSVASFASLFYLFPHTALSVYRHKLWRLRDEIHGDIRRGVIPSGPAADDLIGGVERTIRWAKQMSFANLVIFGVLGKDDAAVDARFNEMESRIEALPPRCKHVVRNYQYKFARITLNHVLFFTPSGWFATVVSLPFLPFMYLWARREARKAVRREGEERQSEHAYFLDQADAWRVQARLPVRRNLADSRELELLIG